MSLAQSVSSGAQRAAVIQSLRRRIGRCQAAQRRGGGLVVSSGCPAIDRLLPDRGFVPGTLNEWLGDEGEGAATLSLLAARSAGAGGKPIVVIDSRSRFYPPAAAAWGIPLERLVILRAPEGPDLFWAIDQALRWPAVGAVWGRVERASARWLRRWQLAAETGGTLGLLVRPRRAANQPSWSEVQLEVIPRAREFPRTVAANEKTSQHELPERQKRWLEVRVVRVRGAGTGGTAQLEIDEQLEIDGPLELDGARVSAQSARQRKNRKLTK